MVLLETGDRQEYRSDEELDALARGSQYPLEGHFRRTYQQTDYAAVSLDSLQTGKILDAELLTRR